ncbi:hypothetical protein GW17_00036847 [Ensete ventricosum]|nr:hypothetical protein GW17_00036847 [Ensete ventricosum]
MPTRKFRRGPDPGAILGLPSNSRVNTQITTMSDGHDPYWKRLRQWQLATARPLVVAVSCSQGPLQRGTHRGSDLQWPPAGTAPVGATALGQQCPTASRDDR